MHCYIHAVCEQTSALVPAEITHPLRYLNIAAYNQVNSTFFHSQANREKELEEVSSLLAKKLKSKPKVKNLYCATSST